MCRRSVRALTARTAIKPEGSHHTNLPTRPQHRNAGPSAAAVKSPGREEGLIAADGLEVDLVAHVVRRDGEEVHLTRTEFELLRVLVVNRGRLLTHRALLSEVWGPGYADDTQILRTHIARLRRKIEPPDGACRHYVRTEPGVGFRFDPR